MIDVVFSKVEGGSRIRGDNITGTCAKLPEIGQCFQMTVPILNDIGDCEGIRGISTSAVAEIEESGDEIKFKTLNSVYKLRVISVLS